MASDSKITVAIADDNQSVRSGIRRLLERSPNIKVIGEASDGQEALRIVEEQVPDVLILDILMPIMDGITVIEMLQAMDVDTTILVLTSIDDPVFKEESLSLGACSYLCKDDVFRLLDTVQQAAQGECESVDEDEDSGFTPRHVMIY